MKNIYFFSQRNLIYWLLRSRFIYRSLLVVLTILHFSFSGYAQKNKDIIVRACTQEIGNGLYRVNFGYDNPTKKEVIIDENGSIIKSNNGKRVAKGLNKFKSGSVEKAFTMEFEAKGSVEWTVTSPSGRKHTVIANANSSHCPDIETGFIFPVIGQGDGKRTDIYGSEGYALAKGLAGDNPSEVIYQLDDNKEKVLIEVVPNPGFMQQALSLLQNTYLVPTSDFLIDPALIISENLTTIDVLFPIAQLDNLNLETSPINFIRILPPSFTDVGIVTTQGDSVQRSNLVRDSFQIFKDGKRVPVNGEGMKIGVISDSYDTQPFTNVSKATIDVKNGDLPGFGNPNLWETPVEVLKEYSYGTASDEGRAMLHLIHDVAPGSDLGFYSGILSPRSFEIGVGLFTDLGYHFVVDDITFPLESFFGNSRISLAIQAFTSLPGRIYTSSAGNFGDKAHNSIFVPSSTAPITNFLPASSPARANVFGLNPDGTEDYLLKIHVEPGVYMIVLQSDENNVTQDNNNGGAITDLDIYIVDDFGNLIVGTNRDNTFGDTGEIMVFEAKDSGVANIMITSANGAPASDLPIRFIAFRADGLDLLEYSGAATTSGHAMTSEALIVAAVDIRTADNPEVQFFSSHGGDISNGFYSEVDLSAPNGVYTNVSSVGQFLNSGDIFKSFFGTSASAPHAAASMALLMSAQPSWSPDGFIVDYTPKTNALADQAIQLFKQNAISTGNPEIGGAGFIDVEKVFKSIANPTSKLLKLVKEDGKTPGIDSLTVTILGEYFLSEDETTVLFEGEELEIISISETEIVVQVAPFTGGSEIVVNSDSITPGGTDGGDSNPLSLLEDGKLAIDIIADDVTFKYGQAVSYSYRVIGLPEGDSYESTGLPEVIFNTPAVFPFPDVNNYVLTPDFDSELTEDQLASYQVNFINGIFSVTKNDLTITPSDETYTYGDAVEVILNYVLLNEDGIDDTDAFLNFIQTSHQSDFYEENTLILINKLRAVVNEQEILNLLNEGSWMTSKRAIQNKLRAVVNGMNLIDLEPQHFQDYIDAVTDPETNKLRAVVNKLRAVVNGQDLIDNLIDLVIENKLRAVVNGTGLGDENDKNDYSFIFAVVDAEDGSTETEERRIDTLYSMNLITGIEVTASEEGHLLFPGALLNAVGANLNVTYGSSIVNFLPKTATVRTSDLEINYGDIITSEDFTTVFEGLVYGETPEIVFPEGIPYYFVDIEGTEYEIGDNKDVGEYEIRIRNPQNYILEFPEVVGILTVTKSTLNVTITEDLVIDQYDIILSSDISSQILGFVNGDDVLSVFGETIPYYFVDAQGNEYLDGDTGGFIIKLRPVQNYLYEYINVGRLYVNPNGEGFNKIRTYLDCVEHNPDDAEGLFYTAIFSYENPNTEIIHIAEGSENYFSGQARFEGILTTIFMPGSDTFKIRFDGIKLVWNLTSFGSTHKTSVSSESTSESGKCEAKSEDSDTSYGLYPNPVTGILNIQNNISAISSVDIFDIYGVLYHNTNFSTTSPDTIQIDMTDYPAGMYFVQITSSTDVKVYSIIKQ